MRLRGRAVDAVRAFDGACAAEVGNLHDAILANEERGGPEVDEEDAASLVNALQRGEHVEPKRQYGLLGKGAVLSQQRAQVAAGAVLCDDPEVVGRREPRVELEHVGVVE